MSAAMGLTVVAEGVETTAQHEVLVGFGVTLGQGYLWSPPVSAGEFVARWSPFVVSAGGS